MGQYSAHNYHPLPVVLEKGKSARVWDVDGKEYLDFLACYSALNFGHQHPKLVGALKEQLDRLAVCSRAFYSKELALFSEELVKFCGLETALLMNSGAEAVETAMKVARKWGYEKKKVAPDRAKIIALENNFHGRTISIVSYSSEGAYRSGFGPFTPGFTVVPFSDVDALAKAIDDDTVAVLLEPIQAEAGILIPYEGYLKDVRALCTKRGVLMMLDEIQTGMGRTGKDFCFQHEGAVPDVLILGKSLGGGLIPVSAMVSTKAVMDVIKPGQHGSTFGGNPLGCAVGRATLKLMRDERFSDRANAIGAKAMEILRNQKLPLVKEIRGKGALMGIDLDPASGGARKYCERLAQEGVLCKETHDYVIRIAPPLVITDQELKTGMETVVRVIQEMAK
jgi:ornithine--oxo-acid transaminase